MKKRIQSISFYYIGIICCFLLRSLHILREVSALCCVIWRKKPVYSRPRTFLTSSSVVTLFLMGGNRPENPLGVTSTFGPSPHSAHSDTHFMVSTVTPISSASSLKYPRAFFPPFCVQVGPVQTTTLEPSSRAVGASNSWVLAARESPVCVGPKASVKTPIADSRRRAVLVLDMMTLLLLLVIVKETMWFLCLG